MHDGTGHVVAGGVEFTQTCLEVPAGRISVAFGERGTAQLIAQVGIEGLSVDGLGAAPRQPGLFQQRSRLGRPSLAAVRTRANRARPWPANGCPRPNGRSPRAGQDQASPSRPDMSQNPPSAPARSTPTASTPSAARTGSTSRAK